MGEHEQIAEMADALIAWSGDVPDRPLEPSEEQLGSAITGPVLDWLRRLATAPQAEPVCRRAYVSYSGTTTQQVCIHGCRQEAEPVCAEADVVGAAYAWTKAHTVAPGWIERLRATQLCDGSPHPQAVAAARLLGLLYSAPVVPASTVRAEARREERERILAVVEQLYMGRATRISLINAITALPDTDEENQP